MRIASATELTPDQQSILEARSGSLPARVVERSRVVLLAAEGKQDKEIGVSCSLDCLASRKTRRGREEHPKSTPA